MHSCKPKSDTKRRQSRSPMTLNTTQITLPDGKTTPRGTGNLLNQRLSPLHVSSSSPRNLTQPPDIIIHSPHNERKEISKEHIAVKSIRRKQTNSRTRRRKRSSDSNRSARVNNDFNLLDDSASLRRLSVSDNESNYSFESDSRLSSPNSILNVGRAFTDHLSKCISVLDRRGQYYFMNHKRRGYFAIFNFQVCGDKIRQGSEKDTERLDNCFTKLGFQTEVLQNCTTAEMDRELKRLMAIDQTDCDCFGMAILSHGENGRISTRDGSISLENLIRKVKKCESLLGKPKLIFVQSCRLDNNLTTDASIVQSIPKLTIESDLLVSYATTKGNVAYRSPDLGSPYIQILTEILEAKGDKESLFDLLTEVNAKLQEMVQSLGASCEQVSIFETTLKKKLQFDKIVAVYTKYSDGRIEYENKLEDNIQEQTHVKSTQDLRN
ncbi:caspase-7-like isoform X1 [Mytilus edulis]|uniref:caspase-7-like isoform X1 n=1 Tax=Mytilus edulis TaxID=6550 RepID=UPI0039EF92D1